MILGIIAGLLSIFGFIPYVLSILKGKTCPSRVTWFIWTWVGLLIFINYQAAGANHSKWISLVYFAMPLVVALMSIKYGDSAWTKFDIACLFAAAAASVFWYATSSALLSLILFLFIDFFGAIPTIVKTYHQPSQESSLAWFLMVLANFVNLFAVEEYVFSLLLYPVYMVVVGGVIFLLTIRGRVFSRTANKDVAAVRATKL